MTARTLATLDPNRRDGSLSLAQGNLVVTTNVICDFHRKVLGTLGFATGTIGYEMEFYSTSDPQTGLTNLVSIGVADVSVPTNTYVGEDLLSFGLRPSDGSGNAGFYNNNALVGSTFPFVGERNKIGVALFNDPATPIVSFQVNGNYLGQMALTAGHFYLPAIGLGATAAAGDVSAIVNFGQNLFYYPNMSVLK